MVNFDIEKMIKGYSSRYSLVIAVAKRAREITDQAVEQDEDLIEKSVSIAAQEISEGKYRIVESL